MSLRALGAMVATKSGDASGKPTSVIQSSRAYGVCPIRSRDLLGKTAPTPVRLFRFFAAVRADGFYDLPPMVSRFPELDDLGFESHRLLHGRGGCFPGLEHVTIDWFAPVILVTFYAEDGANRRVLLRLEEAAGRSVEVACIVVQERHLPGSPKRVVYGVLPENPCASESALSYRLTLDRNQNHGFFLDMKPGRDWVRAQSLGMRVLNLFAYTCSLSVAAIAGGAESVSNLDMSSGALAMGRANHRINFGDERCRRVSYLAHDLFKSWGRVKRGGPYDLVLIDPPSSQLGSFVAEKDYVRVVRRLPDLTDGESRILACLNSPHLDESFLTGLFSEYRFLGRLPQAAGFEDVRPEGALKCLVFECGGSRPEKS